MSEPALRPTGDESLNVHTEWFDLSFHRIPDHFLSILSPQAYMVLGAILVDVWTENRHVVVTNKQIMALTRLSRSTLKDALRELQDERIITAIVDPEYPSGRVIQLNWTLKLKSKKGEKFSGKITDDSTEGGRYSDPGGVAIPPPPPLKELVGRGRYSDPGGVSIPTGGARHSDPPGGRYSDPPSYMRDSKQRQEREQQQDADNLLLLSRKGEKNPALEDAYLDERITPSEARRLREAISVMTGPERERFEAKLNRHEESERRLGPLDETEEPIFVKVLERHTVTRKGKPAGGSFRQDCTTGQREFPHP